LLSRSVREQIQAMCPNLLIVDSFGSTESGINGQLGQARDGWRRLAPSESVIVLDEALRPVGPGGIGHIAVSGHVPLGYYGDEAATKATFPVINGTRWALLGDMAEVDRDGSIIVAGRGAMCINTGGEKVFPEEVEQALKGHPAVMDALVAGVPDERFGERAAAVVSLRPGHVGRHGRVAGALHDDAGPIQGAGQDRLRHPGNAFPRRESPLPLGACRARRTRTGTSPAILIRLRPPSFASRRCALAAVQLLIRMPAQFGDSFRNWPSAGDDNKP
jgi:hypothetical protein